VKGVLFSNGRYIKRVPFYLNLIPKVSLILFLVEGERETLVLSRHGCPKPEMRRMQEKRKGTLFKCQVN